MVEKTCPLLLVHIRVSVSWNRIHICCGTHSNCSQQDDKGKERNLDDNKKELGI